MLTLCSSCTTRVRRETERLPRYSQYSYSSVRMVPNGPAAPSPMQCLVQTFLRSRSRTAHTCGLSFAFTVYKNSRHVRPQTVSSFPFNVQSIVYRYPRGLTLIRLHLFHFAHYREKGVRYLAGYELNPYCKPYLSRSPKSGVESRARIRK